MESLDLSVIVPLSAAEKQWKKLCSYLAVLPDSCEIIFVRPAALTSSEASALALLERKFNVHWITSQEGRAMQMNAGAKYASKAFLWFLHADTQFSTDTVKCLLQSIQKHPQAIHYFNLAFLSDGPFLSKLNAWGAYFRSHCFKLPFGDQGFCLPRLLFFQLGSYDEAAPYGEDHLLIWQAHKKTVPIVCTGASLYTSARKYKSQGWLTTTLVHAYGTWKQAIPNWLALKLQNWRGKP